MVTKKASAPVNRLKATAWARGMKMTIDSTLDGGIPELMLLVTTVERREKVIEKIIKTHNDLCALEAERILRATIDPA